MVNLQIIKFINLIQIYSLGCVVDEDDDFSVDALVGLIAFDVAVNYECSVIVMVNLMNDDGRQIAYESVVLHTNLLDRDHDLCLEFRKNILFVNFMLKI